jgi:hypothetical protein
MEQNNIRSAGVRLRHSFPGNQAILEIERDAARVQSLGSEQAIEGSRILSRFNH